MDVRINPGQGMPTQPQNRLGALAQAAPSFARSFTSALRSDGAETAEAVFEQALADREHPDLDRLDSYLETLIQREMKEGGL